MTPAAVDREGLRPAQEYVFAPDGPLAEVTVRYDLEHACPLAADEVLVHARQRSREPPEGADPMEAVFTMLVEQDHGGSWKIRMGQHTPVVG